MAQSGSVFGLLLQSSETQRASFNSVLEEANCSNSTDWLACLKSKNASDLAVIRGPQIVFTATVETHNDTEHNFLPDTYDNLFKDGRNNKVPTMIGFVNSEWIASSASKPIKNEKQFFF